MARTKIKVKQLIKKSKDSALFVVEIYDKPRTAFKSSGFIVLMRIAWTSLFHTIFERNNTPYFHKKIGKILEIIYEKYCKRHLSSKTSNGGAL